MTYFQTVVSSELVHVPITLQVLSDGNYSGSTGSTRVDQIIKDKLVAVTYNNTVFALYSYTTKLLILLTKILIF